MSLIYYGHLSWNEVDKNTVVYFENETLHCLKLCFRFKFFWVGCFGVSLFITNRNPYLLQFNCLQQLLLDSQWLLILKGRLPIYLVDKLSVVILSYTID